MKFVNLESFVKFIQLKFEPGALATHIHKMFSTNSLKTAIHENLDLRNISTICDPLWEKGYFRANIKFLPQAHIAKNSTILVNGNPTFCCR